MYDMFLVSRNKKSIEIMMIANICMRLKIKIIIIIIIIITMPGRYYMDGPAAVLKYIIIPFIRNEDKMQCEDFFSLDGVMTMENEWRTCKCCRMYRKRPLRDSYLAINATTIGFPGNFLVIYIIYVYFMYIEHLLPKAIKYDKYKSQFQYARTPDVSKSI